MAQRHYSTHKQRKSDFPIFEYLEMLMPYKLWARFMQMPRHIRWTIISTIASLVVLWAALHFVVGGINSWIDSQGVFLKDSYYLPYNLTERPLPVYPEAVTPGDQFLVLPDRIADQYVLQIPPNEEELQARHKAELDAFLALSLPVEESLTALRETLGEQLGETSAAPETEAAGNETMATPAAEAEAVSDETMATPAAEAEAVDAETVATPAADSQAVPTALPTVDTIQLQVMALNNMLAPLVTLNEQLKDADSIDLVTASAFELQNRLNMLAASGITMPPEIEPFKQRIDELFLLEPPTVYSNNDCLMVALAEQDEPDAPSSTAPCAITQRALHVEQAEYVNNEGAAFNVAVAEFPRPVDAAWAIKQLYYRARAIGFTGNFALDNIIEYNHSFSRIEGVYTLTWTHENWVFSISADTIDSLDSLMKVFPY